MKKIILTFFLIYSSIVFSQVTTNRQPVGLEHNLLFNATTRYKVTQTGTANLNTAILFDGRFVPSYTATAPTTSSPTTILIEGLPGYHTQAGAWVGWSTRYWQAKRFKIEGYNQYNSANTWVTLADYSDKDYTSGASFSTKVPVGGSYTKLRFTFYSSYGTNGRLGVSELFFLHPEAMTPYQGLLSNYWSKDSEGLVSTINHVNIGGETNRSLRVRHINGKDYDSKDYSNLYLNYGTGHDVIVGRNTKESDLFVYGNIGIGTSDTKGYELAIGGRAIAEEVTIKLQSSWPDYVFETSYNLPSLKEVEKHIQENGHLENIPSAKEVEKEGVQLGEMNKKLLEKIEELTLYTIQQEKRIEKLESKNSELTNQNKKIQELEEKLNELLSKK